MRKYSWISLAFVVLTCVAMPMAAIAQASQPVIPTVSNTPPATPIPLTIFTNYPDQVAGVGETVTLGLKVRSSTPGIVELTTDKVPDGWTTSFRGGGRIVSSVDLDGQNDAAVDLRVESPAGVSAGEYTFNVIAKSGNQTATLPIKLTVQEKLPPKLTLSTDLPTLRNKPGSTFRYDVSLKNEGDDDLTVNLGADAPAGFNVSFSLNGQDVTSVPLTGGETKRLSVQAAALDNVPASAYAMTVRAQGADATAELPLSAEIVGAAEIAVTTPDGRLSGEATAGQTTPFKITVTNSGTAPARNISVSATAPAGWETAVEPKDIPELGPGQQLDVTINIKPSDKAVAGDYVVSVSARPADGSAKSVDLRITVTTSTLWGIVGVGLIAVAVGAVGIVVTRFGRR